MHLRGLRDEHLFNRSLCEQKGPVGFSPRLCWGTQRPAQGSVPPRNQYMVVFKAVIPSSTSTQSRTSQVGRPGDSRGKAPHVLSQWRHTGHTSCPQQRVMTAGVKCPPGSSLETLCLGCMESSSLDALCLALSKIPDSQKECSSAYKLHCWLRSSEASLFVRA